MTSLGIRELKENLGYFVSLLKKGEAVTLKYRGKALAVVNSLVNRSTENADEQALIRQLEKENVINLSSGKVNAGVRPVKTRGRSIADIVIEARE